MRGDEKEGEELRDEGEGEGGARVVEEVVAFCAIEGEEREREGDGEDEGFVDVEVEPPLTPPPPLEDRPDEPRDDDLLCLLDPPSPKPTFPSFTSPTGITPFGKGGTSSPTNPNELVELGERKPFFVLGYG